MPLEKSIGSIVTRETYNISTAPNSSTMATAGPSRPNGPQDYNGKGGPRSRYQANNRKFGTPLPILLPSSPLHPAHQPRHTPSLLSQLVFPSKRPIVPQCVGRYDPITRSVIVENKEDVEILFRRGFFGKGTLSRSEPTWKARRVDMIKGGECELHIP